MAAHLVQTPGRGSMVPSVAHCSGLTDRQLRRVEEYMLQYMDGDLGVEDLAAAAGLSPVYFARQLKLRTAAAGPRRPAWPSVTSQQLPRVSESQLAVCGKLRARALLRRHAARFLVNDPL
jgi:hypothetical protein